MALQTGSNSSTLPTNTRLKNMGRVAATTKKSGTTEENNVGVAVYQFWMTGMVKGEIISDIHTELLKNAKKKANFPGFRKVGFLEQHGSMIE